MSEMDWEIKRGYNNNTNRAMLVHNKAEEISVAVVADAQQVLV